VLREIGVATHFTTAGHPRSHGMIERLHGTLLEHLHLLRIDRGLVGEEAVMRAVLAYNSSIHSVTKRTPHENLILQEEREHADEDRITRDREDQREKQIQKKVERTQRWNQQGKVESRSPLRIGGIVFRKNLCKRRKEDKRFDGPFRVVEILDRHRVVLQRMGRGNNNRRLVAHRNEVRIPPATP
jgi:transposase InsO family protein